MSVDEDDRFGFEDASGNVAALLGRFVPQAVARRAVAVSLTTDRDRYAAGDPVELVIEFRNRLPVPVAVRTPTRRLWGWSVDGELEASDERRYLGEASGVVRFRAGERKRVVHRWDGRFKRVGDPTRWEDPDPGAHEVAAFLALDGPGRPEARTTIHIE